MKPRKDSRRRREIAQIGCELLCLNENDIIYILDDKNDIYDVEMLYYRKTIPQEDFLSSCGIVKSTRDTKKAEKHRPRGYHRHQWLTNG